MLQSFQYQCLLSWQKKSLEAQIFSYKARESLWPPFTKRVRFDSAGSRLRPSASIWAHLRPSIGFALFLLWTFRLHEYLGFIWHIKGTTWHNSKCKRTWQQRLRRQLRVQGKSESFFSAGASSVAFCRYQPEWKSVRLAQVCARIQGPSCLVCLQLPCGLCLCSSILSFQVLPIFTLSVQHHMSSFAQTQAAWILSRWACWECCGWTVSDSAVWNSHVLKFGHV